MHLIENKGVKSECMKFGENSRQMPSVSTICDEYCSFTHYKLQDIPERREPFTWRSAQVKACYELCSILMNNKKQ